MGNLTSINSEFLDNIKQFVKVIDTKTVTTASEANSKLITAINHNVINSVLKAYLTDNGTERPEDINASLQYGIKNQIKEFANGQGKGRMPNKIKAFTAIIIATKLITNNGQTITAQEQQVFDKLKNAIGDARFKISKKGLNNIIKLSNSLLLSKLAKDETVKKDSHTDFIAYASNLGNAFKLRNHHKGSSIAKNVAIISGTILLILGIAALTILSAGIIPGVAAGSIITLGLTVKIALEAVGIGAGILTAVKYIYNKISDKISANTNDPVDQKIKESLARKPLAELLHTVFLTPVKAVRDLHKAVWNKKKDQAALTEIKNTLNINLATTDVAVATDIPAVFVAAGRTPADNTQQHNQIANTRGGAALTALYSNS